MSGCYTLLKARNIILNAVPSHQDPLVSIPFAHNIVHSFSTATLQALNMHSGILLHFLTHCDKISRLEYSFPITVKSKYDTPSRRIYHIRLLPQNIKKSVSIFSTVLLFIIHEFANIFLYKLCHTCKYLMVSINYHVASHQLAVAIKRHIGYRR